MPAIRLDRIPTDVEDVIKKVQDKIKEKRKIRQYSKESTIFHIIKEYSQLTGNSTLVKQEL